MALIDDFKVRFTDFDVASIDTVFPALESSIPNYYGGQYDGTDKEVILQLVAHLFVYETELNRELGGVVDGNQDDQSFYNMTKYGQSFLQLTKFRHGAVSV